MDQRSVHGSTTDRTHLNRRKRSDGQGAKSWGGWLGTEEQGDGSGAPPEKLAGARPADRIGLGAVQKGREEGDEAHSGGAGRRGGPKEGLRPREAQRR